MNKYINGYLESIPQSEKDSVLNFISDTIKNKYSLNETELNIIMMNLVKENSLLTHELNLNASGKPSDALSAFIKDIEADLIYIIGTVNSIDLAIENIREKCSSNYMQIKNELENFEQYLYETELKSNLNEKEIIISNYLKNNEFMQERNETNDLLFLDDRTNLRIPVIDFEIIDEDSYITLSKENEIKHNIAKIELSDFIGKPSNNSNTNYAIDDRLISFYDLSTTQEIPLQNTIDGFSDGGAYSKLKILLLKNVDVSELKLSIIANTQIELCAIYIDNQNILKEPIKINKDLIVPLKHGQFNNKPINELSFLLRQINYTKEIEYVNPDLELIINESNPVSKLKSSIKQFINQYIYKR